YDTAWGTPGADDNASGVSMLLEISREVDGSSLRRPVWLVAYTNEEPPWFRSTEMGSYVHAARMAERGQQPHVMYSLEMLGYFDDAPGSQVYPVGALGWLYGDRGDYVAFVGNFQSVSRVRSSVYAFRRGVQFPTMGAALPAAIPGVDFSDHLNYWDRGWPAVMVTDTSFNRNFAYHEAEDVPESLDYDRMSRVAQGLAAVVREAAR
ncbi:MAG: Zn-dependent M28 family amino/carboxypeptidase, partial [Kiritimatiellia bacterium]